MVPRRSGKIVNIASINSFVGGENHAPYTSSKGGVSQLTKALSNEWARHNVQVNALAPGYVATDMYLLTPPYNVQNLLHIICSFSNLDLQTGILSYEWMHNKLLQE